MPWRFRSEYRNHVIHAASCLRTPWLSSAWFSHIRGCLTPRRCGPVSTSMYRLKLDSVDCSVARYRSAPSRTQCGSDHDAPVASLLHWHIVPARRDSPHGSKALPVIDITTMTSNRCQVPIHPRSRAACSKGCPFRRIKLAHMWTAPGVLQLDGLNIANEVSVNSVSQHGLNLCRHRRCTVYWSQQGKTRTGLVFQRIPGGIRHRHA